MAQRKKEEMAHCFIFTKICFHSYNYCERKYDALKPERKKKENVLYYTERNIPLSSIQALASVELSWAFWSSM